MDPRSNGSANPSDVVRAFIDRIHAHDTEGLFALMSPQHVFIDSLGGKFPYAMAREAWKQYFTMVPDYWIQLEQIVSQGEVVIVFQPWMAMEQEHDNRKRDNRTPACGRRPFMLYRCAFEAQTVSRNGYLLAKLAIRQVGDHRRKRYAFGACAKRRSKARMKLDVCS